MGYVATVRNRVDGKTYTVSTVKKFNTWESAIFEGSNALLMGLGRRMRYMEYVFPWDEDERAERTHRELAAMAQDTDPHQWEMTKADVVQARAVATAFVTNEGPKLLSLIERDSWRVRKGGARNPRGFSVPLFIPEAADPLMRYAQKLVTISREAALAFVNVKEKVTLGLVSEFAYFFIQCAQRQGASKLSDAQMREVVPRLCFAVCDLLLEGQLDGSADQREVFKADWINKGADRNDLYSKCRLTAGPNEGLGGTLFWEASKVLGGVAKVDLASQVSVAVLLGRGVSQLDAELLYRAANGR